MRKSLVTWQNLKGSEFRSRFCTKYEIFIHSFHGLCFRYVFVEGDIINAVTTREFLSIDQCN